MEHRIFGALSADGTTESSLNLAIGLKLQKLLEQSGAKIILTRSDENGIYSGTSIEMNSGFNGKIDSGNEFLTTGLVFPDSKYYDSYITSVETTACNGGICYGHALSETNKWYDDISIMIRPKAPWLIRGGDYTNSNRIGIFFYHHLQGNNHYNVSTRVVFVEK